MATIVMVGPLLPYRWLMLACAAAFAVACGSSERGADPAPRVPAAVPVAPKAEEVAAAPAPSSRPMRQRIVFLGDSLTAGYGLERDQAVPALIQARLDAEGQDYEVVNAGVSGDTSAGGLSRLDWALEGDVRILVIELGANDGLRGLPTENMQQNLAETIRRAQARRIAVVLTGMEAPPNYGPAYTAAFRGVFASLARTPDVVFVPFFLDGVAGIPRLNIADGIHPNAEGARIVAGTVWQALRPLLEKQDR
jgi:acyl-CoA thioesterase-1